MKHTLIVMMGPSGSGKSYMAKLINRVHEDCVTVSRDAIRFSLLQNGEDYFAHETEVKIKYYRSISEQLKNHRYVIADATHLSKKSRKELFNNVVLPEDSKIIGIWIDVPLHVALEQNQQRVGLAKTPEKVIRDMFRYKVSPTPEEPFNDVIYVTSERRMGISQSDPTVTGVFEKIEKI